MKRIRLLLLLATLCVTGCFSSGGGAPPPQSAPCTNGCMCRIEVGITRKTECVQPASDCAEIGGTCQ